MPDHIKRNQIESHESFLETEKAFKKALESAKKNSQQGREALKNEIIGQILEDNEVVTGFINLIKETKWRTDKALRIVGRKLDRTSKIDEQLNLDTQQITMDLFRKGKEQNANKPKNGMQRFFELFNFNQAKELNRKDITPVEIGKNDRLSVKQIPSTAEVWFKDKEARYSKGLHDVVPANVTNVSLTWEEEGGIHEKKAIKSKKDGKFYFKNGQYAAIWDGFQIGFTKESFQQETTIQKQKEKEKEKENKKQTEEKINTEVSPLSKPKPQQLETRKRKLGLDNEKIGISENIKDLLDEVEANNTQKVEKYGRRSDFSSESIKEYSQNYIKAKGSAKERVKIKGNSVPKILKEHFSTSEVEQLDAIMQNMPMPDRIVLMGNIVVQKNIRMMNCWEQCDLIYRLAGAIQPNTTKTSEAFSNKSILKRKNRGYSRKKALKHLQKGDFVEIEWGDNDGPDHNTIVTEVNHEEGYILTCDLSYFQNRPAVMNKKIMLNTPDGWNYKRDNKRNLYKHSQKIPKITEIKRAKQQITNYSLAELRNSA